MKLILSFLIALAAWGQSSTPPSRGPYPLCIGSRTTMCTPWLGSDGSTTIGTTVLGPGQGTNIIGKGADPAGVANSAAAFTAAFTADSVAYCPTGTFKTLSTITVPAGKSLRLEPGCVINYSGPGSAVLLAGSRSELVGSGTINHSPSAASQDAIVIGTLNATFGDNNIIGVVINGTTNTRDHIRVLANVVNLTIKGNSLLGPGPSNYTSGAGVRLLGNQTSGDFNSITGNTIQRTAIGVSQESANFTSSEISRNGFASIYGPCVQFPSGAGQSAVTLNTFYACNIGAVGGALSLAPTSPAYLNDMDISSNSFQVNGSAVGTSIDMLVGSGAGQVNNIQFNNNQCNNVESQSGSKICLQARNVTVLNIAGNSCDQTGSGRLGCFDVDATNSTVSYGTQRLVGATEFVSSAGVDRKPIVENAAGRVGIGTSSPVGKFQISGASPDFVMYNSSGSANSKYYYVANFNNLFIVSYANDAWTGWGSIVGFSNNGGMSVGGTYSASTPPAHGLMVQGSVGIGVTSPAAKLDVAGTAKILPVAVASLPTCNAASAGSYGGVTDALSPSWGATVANGGAAKVPVYCDGTNWIVH